MSGEPRFKWTPGPPFNLKRWLAKNAEKLKPPVSNYMIYQEGDFQVRVLRLLFAECNRSWYWEGQIADPIFILTSERNGFIN